MPVLPLAVQTYGDTGLPVSRTVNMYVQPTPNGPMDSARYPRPGLSALEARGDGPIRLTVRHNGYRYTISGPSVYRDASVIGTIPGRGLIRFARSDEQLVLAHEGKAYLVDSAVTQIADPDLPAVRDVAFCAGRFVYISDEEVGRYHWSAINDATTIDGLDFATAEGSPDEIVSVRTIGEELVFFGSKSIETWYPTGDIAAPFLRSQGRRSDKGLAGQFAVCDLDNAHFWLGTNQDEGQTDLMIYRNSAAPVRISTSAIERLLRRCADVSLITLLPAVADGHSWLVLNIPGVGSYAYDVGNDLWNEWSSFGEDVFRAHLADGGVFGDYATGQLWTLDPESRSDGSDPVVCRVTCFAPLPAGRVPNNNVCLHLETGQEGVVEMRYSDHSDLDWSEAREAYLGGIGSPGRALWHQLGLMLAPGRTYEFTCSDDVRFAPYGVTVNEPVL